MKLLPGKIHLSRKLLLIVGGVAVLCGATGSAAVYIGRDALLGPSYSEVNGLTCMELQSATIKRKDRLWVRKYVTTDATDGVTRIKTALRIAKSVAETEKPDLVQVVVLDQRGQRTSPTFVAARLAPMSFIFPILPNWPKPRRCRA